MRTITVNITDKAYDTLKKHQTAAAVAGNDYSAANSFARKFIREVEAGAASVTYRLVEVKHKVVE